MEEVRNKDLIQGVYMLQDVESGIKEFEEKILETWRRL